MGRDHTVESEAGKASVSSSSETFPLRGMCAGLGCRDQHGFNGRR